MNVLRRRVGEWRISCLVFLLRVITWTSSVWERCVRISSRSSVVAKTRAAGVSGFGVLKMAFARERISESADLRRWETQRSIVKLAEGSLEVTDRSRVVRASSVAISLSRVARVSLVAWLMGESTLGGGGSLTLMDEGWVYGLVSCTAIVR
jgi:hypothetical protein